MEKVQISEETKKYSEIKIDSIKVHGHMKNNYPPLSKSDFITEKKTEQVFDLFSGVMNEVFEEHGITKKVKTPPLSL